MSAVPSVNFQGKVCPHCRKAIHLTLVRGELGRDREGHWAALHAACPACDKYIITLLRSPYPRPGGGGMSGQPLSVLVHPRGNPREPCPLEVPPQFADDYREACLVLGDSPKAAAALARRCLQHLLRECAKVKPGNLFDEIEEAIGAAKLPSHINRSLDSVRSIGNFAAHPIKSKSSGEILDVEPGEAEWTLDTLEALFDFYFVEPARAQEREAKFNAKLHEAGKQPLKT
jgi:hypothetical protein